MKKILTILLVFSFVIFPLSVSAFEDVYPYPQTKKDGTLDLTGWGGYSGDLESALMHMKKGDVIYYKEKYWASPRLINMKEEIIYIGENKAKINNPNPKEEELKQAIRKYLEQHKNLAINKDSWYSDYTLKSIGIIMETPKIDGYNVSEPYYLKGDFRLIDANNNNLLFVINFDDLVNRTINQTGFENVAFTKNDLSFKIMRGHGYIMYIDGKSLLKILVYEKGS